MIASVRMPGRRRFLAATAAFAFVPRALAQPSPKLRRIGYFSMGTSQSDAGWLEAFREGMAQLGWVDGRDYTIDARYANGSATAGPRMASALVTTQPDVLLTTGEGSLRPLAERTKTIPIVFATAADPVGNAFAASLRRPAGNVTGIMGFGQELAAKRLELLKQAGPAISHVAVLFEPANPNSVSQMKELRDAAARLKTRITLLELRNADDIQPAVERALEAGARGFVVTSGFLTGVQKQRISELLSRAKVPSISSFPDAGNLISYAPLLQENFRSAATHVDRILKGANPAELAIEQPTKFELVLNLRTAKAIGAKIAPALQMRADRVID